MQTLNVMYCLIEEHLLNMRELFAELFWKLNKFRNLGFFVKWYPM